MARRKRPTRCPGRRAAARRSAGGNRRLTVRSVSALGTPAPAEVPVDRSAAGTAVAAGCRGIRTVSSLSGAAGRGAGVGGAVGEASVCSDRRPGAGTPGPVTAGPVTPDAATPDAVTPTPATSGPTTSGPATSDPAPFGASWFGAAPTPPIRPPRIPVACRRIRPVATDHFDIGRPYRSRLGRWPRPAGCAGVDGGVPGGVGIGAHAARRISSAVSRSSGYGLVNVTISPVRGCANDSDWACSHCRCSRSRAARVGSAP